MNQFDELFEFRLACESEIDKIMSFIKDYWPKPGHILATDKEFFIYEYCPLGVPNVYLAIDKRSNEIAAMICLYYYEKEYKKGKSDLSTGMFLANPTINVPFVGIELHKRALDDLQPRSYIAPGVNIKTSGPLIKRLLHHKVERMRHYYMPGVLIKPKISQIIKLPVENNEFGEQRKLEEVADIETLYKGFDNESFRKRKPYKDKWYIERRYFLHPIYKYKLFKISNKAAIVCREVIVDGSKALRIVDILGDPGQLRFIREALKILIKDNKYEYIDLYEQKMQEKDLEAAGFIERKERDLNIIPNYFEPFVKENIEIWVHRTDNETLCFKADGDQDRPNHR